MSEEGAYLFIINPKAGKQATANLPKLIQQKAAVYSQKVDIVFTTHAGHAFELASSNKMTNYHTVVAVGGDGTINEIARGLINKTIALAVIPIGSGNGLARYYGIPLKLSAALDLVFSGVVEAMDVIKLNEFYSFNVSGIGFDAAVAHEFQYKKKRGFSGYLKQIVKQIFKYRPVSIRAEMHYAMSKRLLNEKVFILAIANSNQFGNNAIIAPLANTRDGKFNVVIIKPFSFYQLPYYVLMMFKGKINEVKNVISEEVLSCVIDAESSKWHIDGEPVELHSPVEIKVLPLALRIIIPKSLAL